MARLVEGLDDASAVRLGALGPLRAGADALNRKRASFLVTVTREYGAARAEVFALFIIHSAFTDDLHELLGLLARDKQLGATLGRMSAVRETLRLRGLDLSRYVDRPERLGDVARGFASATHEALSSSELRRGAVALNYSVRKGQLPVPYQRALDEVERVEMADAFSSESVTRGSLDALTFGVPLGFYNLVAGTCHGVYSLARGHYEQATRELSAAAVLVSVYAGGKSVRFVSERSGRSVAAGASPRRIPVPELGIEGLSAVAERVWARLGGDGMTQLARYIQAQREAALLVYEAGEAGAVALYESRGNVAKAQAVLAEAKPERAGAALSKPGPGALGAGAGPLRGSLPSDTPIRNAHLAGSRHPVTGVPFDPEGYPDFRAAGAVKAEVRISYTGSRVQDFAAANAAAGLRSTPKGMTWHHHQDRTTMQLVPTDIHARTGHTGGFSGGG